MEKDTNLQAQEIFLDFKLQSGEYFYGCHNAKMPKKTCWLRQKSKEGLWVSPGNVFNLKRFPECEFCDKGKAILEEFANTKDIQLIIYEANVSRRRRKRR
uniref:Uncharacterized protein n=1 Tax=viral metagenome TaxID=1070528 RepID=A0A6M3IZX0_9ZZZZ